MAVVQRRVRPPGVPGVAVPPEPGPEGPRAVGCPAERRLTEEGTVALLQRLQTSLAVGEEPRVLSIRSSLGIPG